MTIKNLLKHYGSPIFAIELFDSETGETLKPFAVAPPKIIDSLKVKSFQIWFNSKENIDVIMIEIDKIEYQKLHKHVIENGYGG